MSAHLGGVELTRQLLSPFSAAEGFTGLPTSPPLKEKKPALTRFGLVRQGVAIYTWARGDWLLANMKRGEVMHTYVFFASKVQFDEPE